MRSSVWLVALSLVCGLACSTGPSPKPEVPAADDDGDGDGDGDGDATADGGAMPSASSDAESADGTAPSVLADVTDVSVTGEAGNYTFAVTLRSPDTGCDQYADWWEVLDADGNLLYRRILGHSHVDEQPFTRSGGPVAAQASDQVFVRAHMNPGGYGGAVFVGTAEAGLAASATEPDVDAGVEASEPQPDGCAF